MDFESGSSSRERESIVSKYFPLIPVFIVCSIPFWLLAREGKFDNLKTYITSFIKKDVDDIMTGNTRAQLQEGEKILAKNSTL